MAVSETYAAFFLNSRSDVVLIELLEISHTSFSKTYRIVRNVVAGLTIGGITYDYLPVKIQGLESRANLDFGISVTMGDLGEALPLELDRVFNADTISTKPTVRYTLYRSDDYSAPLLSPIDLEIENLTFNAQGVAFEAHATPLNNVKTGESFTMNRFPMLRGFV